jgi:hypothetical protein
MIHFLSESIDSDLTDKDQEMIKYNKNLLALDLTGLDIDRSMATSALNDAAEFVANMIIGKTRDEIRIIFRIPEYQITA